MPAKLSRRAALGSAVGVASAAFAIRSRIEAAEQALPASLKGRVNHSVCRWCYKQIALDDLCQAAQSIGLRSVELTGPKEWPTLKKYGLTCAMANGAGMGIPKGFNDPKYHEALIASYSEVIPLVAEAGLTNLICFSGNRAGISDEQGLEASAKGLKQLMKLAEEKKVTLVMELLNSRVNHKDYQCDHTAWGVELCKRVGSERFKLLYDIYHMQIMEGDLIATIKANSQYIAHYHTGGVPGRNEIDNTQEIYYPAVMLAIVDTGYQGFIGQEFIPKRPDALRSLRQGVEICDV